MNLYESLKKIAEDIEVDFRGSAESANLIAVYIDGKGFKKLSKNLTLKAFVDSYNKQYPEETIDSVSGASLSDTLGKLILSGDKIEFSKVLKGAGEAAKTVLIYKK
jgi:Mg2+/Co2+ transporter CorC